MEPTEKKVKRSVRKREKLKAIKEAARTGPAVAYLHDVPTSPRKMRLVADLIRGERVAKALSVLKYETRHPAEKMEKLLMSAISNWETKNIFMINILNVNKLYKHFYSWRVADASVMGLCVAVKKTPTTAWAEFY